MKKLSLLVAAAAAAIMFSASSSFAAQPAPVISAGGIDVQIELGRPRHDRDYYYRDYGPTRFHGYDRYGRPICTDDYGYRVPCNSYRYDPPRRPPAPVIVIPIPIK